MPSHNDFTFYEQAPPAGHSPSLDIYPGETSRATMRVWWPWEDTADQTASSALLGYAEVRADWPLLEGNKYIHRVNPYPHPDWPDNLLLANRLKIEGDLPAGVSARGTAAFDEARAEIEFATVPHGWFPLEDSYVNEPAEGSPAYFRGVPEESYCVRSMGFVERMAVKYQTIPENAGLVWSDGLPAAVKAFVPLYESDITLDWFPVPLDGYNEAGFLKIVGTTNALPFPPPPPVFAPNVSPLDAAGGPAFLTRPAQTLVMGVPEKKLTRMGDGRRAWHVTIKIKFFPYGANRFFRWNHPAGPRYDRLSRAPAGPNAPTLFPPADWRDAFIPPD